jgi:MFS family permease
MVIDALGSGLFGPFTLLYGHAVIGLSLPVAGLAASVASALGLAAGPVAGSMVDRVGAARVVIAGNALAAAGSVGLLLARDLVGFTVASVICAASQRAFWAAFAPLVADIVAVHERERWFGRLRAARYVGATAGGALAGVALLLGERTGLRAMVAIDALSYAVAAALILSTGAAARAEIVAAASARPGRGPRDRPPRSGYRAALADRDNLLLAVLNVCCTLLCTAWLLAMPVYVLDHLHLAAWLPGLLAAVGTGALATTVLVAHRLTVGRSRLRVLAAANLLFAAGCVAFAMAAGPSAPLVSAALLVVAVAALGVGEAVYAPTADALPLVIAPADLAGRYTAVHQFAWGVSGAIAPALTGALLGAGAATVWWVLAAVALATAGAYRLARPAVRARAGLAGAAGGAR